MQDSIKWVIVGERDYRDKPSMLTYFLVVHFMSGVVAYNILCQWMKLSFWDGFKVFFVVHLVYELKDLYGSYYLKKDDYDSNNSIENSIGDQLTSLMGFVVSSKIVEYMKYMKYMNVNNVNSISTFDVYNVICILGYMMLLRLGYVNKLS